MPPSELELDLNERFRQRREEARKRRRRRRSVVLAVAVVTAALVALGATVIGTRASDDGGSTEAASTAEKKKPEPVSRTPLPDEVRGVHVAMPVASLPGKLDHYLSIPGLTALELDVKDENGEVGFLMPATSLARRVGASKPYYKARVVAAKAREAGVYLIGRVVVFEDPMLAAERPDLAIRTSGGGVWENDAGLGWVNPYDERVWDYVLSIAKRPRARASTRSSSTTCAFRATGPSRAPSFRGRRPSRQAGRSRASLSTRRSS